MRNLWSENTPERFWSIEPALSSSAWQEATRKSIGTLEMDVSGESADDLVALTLGEGQFGPGHWSLGFPKRVYYFLKPALPAALRRFLRRRASPAASRDLLIQWPVESRYARFLWEVLRQLMLTTGNAQLEHRSFWPDRKHFSLVLTHDIETAAGQAFVREVANLEEGLGFRSSFNFVLERYPLDFGLMQELRERGFEVGCHGLKHDGKLFSSRPAFMKRAARINSLLREYHMVGFRAPLTHRNPEWMQALEIDYDASFFDTDPFEPVPGGTMCIWPFFLGRFVELPYTLVQDHTLTLILGQSSPELWLEKVKFLSQYRGMALVNSHPDYLKQGSTWKVYREFLLALQHRDEYWQALPSQVCRWWRQRSSGRLDSGRSSFPLDVIRLEHDQLQFGN